MADPATMMLIASAASTAGGISAKSKEAQVEQDQLDSQKAQSHLQAAQQGLARENQLEKVMGAQAAMAGASNTSMASTSFVTLNKEAFQNFNRDEHNSKLSLDYMDKFIASQKTAIRQKRDADMFGMLAGFGFGAANSSKLNGPKPGGASGGGGGMDWSNYGDMLNG